MNIRTDFEVVLWIESPGGAACGPDDLLALLADYPVQAIHEAPGPGIQWSVSFGERAWQTRHDPEDEVDAFPQAITSPLDGPWRQFPDLSELLTAAVGRTILATFPDAGLRCELRADRDPWSISEFEQSYDRIQVGRIVVSPPWQFPEPDDSTIILRITPSLGFGTGHHPSTRLALALLQQVDTAGRDVLDVGTGSGILAMAAARLGAGRVCAIDRDSDAVAAARDNLRHSLTSIDLRHADIGANRMGQFDLVVANLEAAQLEALADVLWAHVRPGGRLLVSGFLTAERDVVWRALSHPSQIVRDEDGWTAAVFARALPVS